MKEIISNFKKSFFSSFLPEIIIFGILTIVFLFFSSILGVGYSFLVQESLSWGINYAIPIGIGFIVFSFFSIIGFSISMNTGGKKRAFTTLFLIWGWYFLPAITHWIGILIGDLGYAQISEFIIEFRAISIALPIALALFWIFTMTIIDSFRNPVSSREVKVS